MIAKFVKQLRNAQNTVHQIERYNEHIALSILRDEYRRLLASPRYQEPRRLNQHGYGLYSQADEDGILAEMFHRIGVTNKTFVEFGIGDGLENNTHALLLDGWRGHWIEGSESSVNQVKTTYHDLIQSGHLHISHAFITSDNIDSLIREHHTGEIDLLSVDIDGNDFHVLNQIACISPRVVVAEYNARKGPSIDWVMAYNPQHSWDHTDYFGASLKAFEKLLANRGYRLVGCSISGVNAFFVRDDLCSEERFLSPFTSENHFEPQRHYLRNGIHTAHRRSYGPWTTAAQLLEHSGASVTRITPTKPPAPI
jgi:hypothetical protein